MHTEQMLVTASKRHMGKPIRTFKGATLQGSMNKQPDVGTNEGVRENCQLIIVN